MIEGGKKWGCCLADGGKQWEKNPRMKKSFYHSNLISSVSAKIINLGLWMINGNSDGEGKKMCTEHRKDLSSSHIVKLQLRHHCRKIDSWGKEARTSKPAGRQPSFSLQRLHCP